MFKAPLNKPVIITVLISVFIFSSWNFIQYVMGLQNHYGAIFGSSYEFQSLYGWLPLIRSIVHGNLMPILPTIDPSAQGLLFFPYLGLWSYALMIKLFGIQAAIIIGQVLFPLLSLILLVRIFTRYLHYLWSISMSLACLLTFFGWPFRAFLIELVQGGGIFNLGVIQTLEISTLPIPSLSVFVFLLLFYISTKQVKLTVLRISILTFLWGLLSQFHPVDAIFGIAFWFVFFPIRLFRQKQPILKFLLIIISQLIIICIVLTPLFWGYKNALSSEFAFTSEIGIIYKQNEINFFYYFAYFIIPVVSIAIIYFIKRIDLYEIFIKFWHIYILLLIELLLVSMNYMFNIGIDLDIIQNRIALFFLHFYYYVPIIYYAKQTIEFDYSFGIESKRISRCFNKILNFIFYRFNKIYLPIIILLLFLYSAISAISSYKHQMDFEAPTLNQAWDEFAEIKDQISNNSVVVSYNPAINLLATIDLSGQYSSLWINRFTNEISREEAIDRLILYARIFNWSFDEFYAFMSSGNLQKKNGIVDLSISNVKKSGVGYWLVYHKYNLNPSQMDDYKSYLLQKYFSFNITESIKRFNVKYIHTKLRIEESIPIKLIYQSKNSSLYAVNN